MVSNNAAYPLNMLQNNAHHETCATSCYNCLRHYGNMPYHGLLDWELGLSFLNVLVNPAFKCGLDGNFSVFGLREWKTSAGALADDMAKRFEGSDGAQRKDFEGIQHLDQAWGESLSLDSSAAPTLGGSRAFGLHDSTIFARAQHAAESYDGMVPLSWDSFNFTDARLKCSSGFFIILTTPRNDGAIFNPNCAQCADHAQAREMR